MFFFFSFKYLNNTLHSIFYRDPLFINEIKELLGKKIKGDLRSLYKFLVSPKKSILEIKIDIQHF